MPKSVLEAQVERQERARELIASKSYVVAGPSVFVYSDRPGVAGYEVVGGRCSCPDATVGSAWRAGIPCKHALVARAVLTARRLIVQRPDAAKRIAEVA